MAGSSPAFLVLTALETVSQYQTEKSTDPRRATLNTAAHRILIMPFIFLALRRALPAHYGQRSRTSLSPSRISVDNCVHSLT